METILKALFDAVVNGMKVDVEARVREAQDAKIPSERILNEGLIAAMKEVGLRFECGNLYVPEMLIAARAMQSGLAILKRDLIVDDVASAGKIVMGTVQGDLHDIGKNLVAMMLEGAGYEVIDLGTNVAAEKFANTVRESGADVIGLSALLTTTMQNMKSVIEAIDDIGMRNKVKIIVGGAPVTESFAKEIGADGYAPDASRAVTVVKSFG